MKIKIEANFSEPKFQVGDVVTFNDEHGYLIVDDGSRFIARGLDGRVGATGHHDSLEALEKSLRRLSGYRHFSKDNFELVLKPRK